MSNQQLTVVGAGLCGSLLALRLAQRGYHIHLFEKRPAPAEGEAIKGRSINLALSDRGLLALSVCGMKEKALEIAIPMVGRAIHPFSQMEPSYVNYSGREGEAINSISRRDLTILILKELALMPNVSINYQSECMGIDEKTKTIAFQNVVTNEIINHSYETLFSTDGANSAIRARFMELAPRIRFDNETRFLDTGYKELEIPAGDDHSYLLSKNHLHIWPRKGFMMIALPNMDGSFTVTLFMPFEGEMCFDKVKTDQEIRDLFAHYFPTAVALMPDLINDFHTNPTSSLWTLKCYPWVLDESVLLMGDAAHAIVPFYGQGMNASFEDVLVLDSCIDEYNGDWKEILSAYQRIRKEDTDAIADLASDNYYEMRDATADPIFTRKRNLELKLEQTYPDYYSKYSLVTFREDVPYRFAMRRGRAQDTLLMDIVRRYDDINLINLDQVMNEIRQLS